MNWDNLYLVVFVPFFSKEDNIHDFRLVFLYPLRKALGVTYKSKEFAHEEQIFSL